LTVKYPGKKWSAGTILLLMYWLMMLGFVVNAGIYFNMNQRNENTH
tara:strand:+ start:78 stop:215 length:138 start_codon:yes stop_codon:yes gene_type:complete